MRNSIERVTAWSLAIFVALLCTLTVSQTISTAQPDVSITVTNNSDRDVTHLYTSPPERDQWGPDQLPEGSALRPGQSITLSSVSCTASGVKLIAEDTQGCFVYAIVSAADVSHTWSITNDLPVDCGN
jgi:hypothetical protein